MKALLLAAGRGKRLGAVTKKIPKPLLSVRGKPILEHNIELCRRYGITEIYINTHYQAQRIRNFFGDGSRFGVRIRYSYEKKLLGTAGALLKFKDALKSGSFFVIYADNWISYNLSSIYAFYRRKKGIATVVLYAKKEVRHSGIALLDKNNRIVRFIEKPSPSQRISNLVNAGVYLFSKEIFRYIPKKGASDFGRDIFPLLLRERKDLFGIVLKDKLIPVDTPQMYAKAKGL